MVVLTSLLVAPLSVSAHPPTVPDNGLNETTFAPLWSNDTDEYVHSGPDSLGSSLRALASGTDIPLDEPPLAVERWNRGEHTAFPKTDRKTAAAPMHATLDDGKYIRDAHATILSVQPSTVLHRSATEQTHYIAPSGTVLGVVDFRVRTPSGGRSENRSVSYSLSDARVNQTRLLVDGSVVARENRTRTPSIAYSDLNTTSESTTLTLEATIEATIRTHRRTCRAYNATLGSCTDWRSQTRYRRESIVVSDEIDVRIYELAVSGYVGRYPDGDLGLVVYKSDPWGGYDRSDSSGEVNGIWRFYSARNLAWDTLERHRSDSTQRVYSPIHPLQVHAFPIEVGPTASPQPAVTIQDTFGETLTPPTLPQNVSLDVVEEPYTASYGVATRWEESNTTGYPGTVIAHGLVRGIETTRPLDTFEPIPIRESNLTLSIHNRSDEAVRIRVTLLDTETNEPIETKTRDGYLIVAGERVETNTTGVVVHTLPADSGSVSARYVPGKWWLHNPSYIGDSDSLYVRRPMLDLLSTLFIFSVPVSLFLLAVFLIDRITGWRLWPPWRTQ